MQHLQRAAGNAAVEQLISGWAVQRVPPPDAGVGTVTAPPTTATPTATATRTPAPGSIQDASKLHIEPAPSWIHYYEFVRYGNRIIFQARPERDDPSEWMLLDPLKSEVETRSGVTRYDLFPAVIRRRVEDRGPTAFGVWTLRFQSGPYYDEVFIRIMEGPGPTPTLEGQTSTGLFNIRSTPGGPILANLPGTPIPVVVTDKAELDSKTGVWYQITLKAPLTSPKGKMAAGESGWVTAEGVIAKVTWPFFLAQVAAFEAANKTLSLDARITKLRQWSHEKKLNFDSVIGTAHGTEYLDTRGFVKEEWQILKDSQVVTTPSGEDVNVYHLIVGLDVLTKKVEHQTDWGFAIGQNYAASTWSGDLGSAAADALLAQDKDWEGVFISPKASDPSKRSARLTHYYETRAPEAEMLGDLDAWGIDAERTANPSLNSIAKLLASYYGPTTAGTASRKPATGKRKKSIEVFLSNYGFDTMSALKSQTTARDRMKEQVFLFAKQWLRNRKNSPYSGSDQALADMTSWYIEPMLDQYLDWLDRLVKAYGAVIAPVKATPTP